MKNNIEISKSVFENIKHIDEYGNEYWYARELQKVLDYKLSRYDCYFIVQNADPRKESVALGQTYFAIQTRNKK